MVFLDKNIKSSCNIDYPNIEITAFDDGSQDNSVDPSEFKSALKFSNLFFEIYLVYK